MKRTIQFGEDGPTNTLYPVPHGQGIFGIPVAMVEAGSHETFQTSSRRWRNVSCKTSFSARRSVTLGIPGNSLSFRSD
jgi:hypothetical protein